MNTLTYGRKQPSVNDDSNGADGWMEAITENIARDDAHDHDGVNSKKLDSRSVISYTSTTGTVWTPSGNGLFEMTINMPTGLDFDKYDVRFKTSAGQQAMLDVVKITASSFKVYTNDNTQNYTVLFTS